MASLYLRCVQEVIWELIMNFENLFVRGESSVSNDNTEGARDTNVSKDFMDEELLKVREVTLSESEKQTLKSEAVKLTIDGNYLFRSGEYAQAESVYTQGIQTCPLAYAEERSILYTNRAFARRACLDEESAISDCTKAIEINSCDAQTYIWRARLYVETDKLDKALEDFKKVLTFDPVHEEANYEVQRLPPLIHEKNEKLKG